MTLKDRIGIVIIGRNEGKRLVLCLKSVLQSGVPVVYVDSQSTDNSVYNAQQYNIPTLILDKTKPINASRARNEGFKLLLDKKPNIDYIHFIDADCELDKDWLEQAVLALDMNQEWAVVCGRLREKFRNNSVYMRLCDMDWFTSPGEIDKCGGIATIRRSVFESLSGFNEDLIAGADPELYFRIRNEGWKIYCLPCEMGTHDSAMLYFSQWWKRSTKVGFGYANAADWGGWGKQYRSALVWGASIPFIILCGLLWTNYSLILLALYPIQVTRILINNKIEELSVYDKFIYAYFCVLAKFPQTQGILKFLINNKIFNRKQVIIEYKANS